ncbi:MAG: DegV family EDD domain-containing protein, partial [Lachnospiraceae bacterium]|nr:DegV family EDD domain-containing protein [Lachnospiraceae bacterium]
ADIPEPIIKKLNIPVIPFLIHTENGTFKDGVQMEANEFIRYINSGKSAVSSPPDVREFTDFFAGVIKKAHHVIHIALTTSVSTDYERAKEAAKSFDNVTVVNSTCLSSATGLLVMIACKLAQQNIPVNEIVSELEEVKKRLRCSFVINTTEFMAKKNLINPKVHALTKAINLHPCLNVRNDKSGIGGVWFGSTKRAYKKYIQKAFPVDIIPDSDVVFITYVDVPLATLNWIKEEISKIAYFERVVFKQASAAISSNCGPGTFGILYFVKSNKSYNIGSFIDDEERAEREAEAEAAEEETVVREVRKPAVAEQISETETTAEAATEPEGDKVSGQKGTDGPWYYHIEGLNGDEAIKNSGSEDAFKTVLKIFYDSMPAKAKELDGYYSGEDWQNYTIKIHAMKSSAKLIGAMELSDKAFKLEMAGKEGNVDYIRDNHEDFMKDFAKFKEPLSAVFEDKKEVAEDKPANPVADSYLMESVYESLTEAAEAMDCDMMDEVFSELAEYSLSPVDEEKIKAIREKADNFDYDGVLEILNGNNNQN